MYIISGIGFTVFLYRFWLLLFYLRCDWGLRSRKTCLTPPHVSNAFLNQESKSLFGRCLSRLILQHWGKIYLISYEHVLFILGWSRADHKEWILPLLKALWGAFDSTIFRVSNGVRVLFTIFISIVLCTCQRIIYNICKSVQQNVMEKNIWQMEIS